MFSNKYRAKKCLDAIMNDAESAKQILEIVPRTMRVLRSEIRALAKSELTVPQFRILIHLSESARNNNQLAESQGVSVAAMSRMVDGLVKRGLIKRAASLKDRRQIFLELSAEGRKVHERLQAEVQKSLASRVSKLDNKPKQALIQGLNVLGEMFP